MGLRCLGTVGIGRGLTTATDRWTVKAIFGILFE
jgi:hypothetical protein